MSDLSIEEVESISILKDASATAVYGVRAANGVVLVTTRKGVYFLLSLSDNRRYLPDSDPLWYPASNPYPVRVFLSEEPDP